MFFDMFEMLIFKDSEKNSANIEIVLRHTDGDMQKACKFLRIVDMFKMLIFKNSEKPGVILRCVCIMTFLVFKNNEKHHAKSTILKS